MSNILSNLGYLEKISKHETVVDPVKCPRCQSEELFRIESFGRCITCGAVIVPLGLSLPEVYGIPWEEFSRIPEYGKNVNKKSTQK